MTKMRPPDIPAAILPVNKLASFSVSKKEQQVDKSHMRWHVMLKETTNLGRKTEEFVEHAQR